MNFVKHFELFGVDARQITCITGDAAPSALTEGAVGCFYMDTSSKQVYKCTSEVNGVYTWEVVGAKGDKGDPGSNGYTPVKGKDYYTEADKAEMVQLVLAAIPDGDEVAY